MRRQYDCDTRFPALRQDVPGPSTRHQVHAVRRLVKQDVLRAADHGDRRVQVPPVTTAGHDNDGQFSTWHIVLVVVVVGSSFIMV